MPPLKLGSPHIALFERTRPTKTLPAETRLTVHTNPDAVAEIARANKGFSLPVIWAPGGKAPNPLAAAWDMRGFCLRAFGEDERAMVRALHHGLMEGQLLVTIGGSANPFGGVCLCLTLADRVSQATQDTVLAQQRDHAALLEAAAATGIGARLHAAGLRPRALTPRWAKTLHSVGRKGPDGTHTTHVLATTHPVVFFLTPGWHTTGQAGWYSVEDLDAWIAGTGPVLHG